MSTLSEWLLNYGLGPTEINVFLCIVKNPKLKVSDIQRLTGLVRTTIYHSVASLKSKGLISESRQNNVRTYRASSISNLSKGIQNKIDSEQKKLDTLAKLEPIFETLQGMSSKDESFISRFEGVSPVKQSIEEALRCKSKGWLVMASRDNFLFHTSKVYKAYYLEERKRRGIVSKTLWEPVSNFEPKLKDDPFDRNPRHLPESFKGKFNSLVILYDDSILIVDPFDQKTSHIIHNQEANNLMGLMFDFIWDSQEAP